MSTVPAPGSGPAGGAGADRTPAAVSLADVGVRFNEGRANEVHALDGITLDVQAGEFVSLIGPSGCGKSTLLRVVADLQRPTSGDVSVNGVPAARARRDRSYGFVFQSATLFDWRSVLDNVRLPLEVMGVPRRERDARAREMLELVGLSAFDGHRPWQLSGGMQQRVSIARALSFRPSLLLMDEPFGALDEMTRERMQTEVLRIWRETGTTVVFVTHSIPEAVFLSTRVVVMSPRPGRIADVVDVGLPRVRDDDTREDQAFYDLVTRVRESLRRLEHPR
ncbi:MAG: ABC transporter ATP-binding protein [Kineosporiaceae bacterium]